MRFFDGHTLNEVIPLQIQWRRKVPAPWDIMFLFGFHIYDFSLFSLSFQLIHGRDDSNKERKGKTVNPPPGGAHLSKKDKNYYSFVFDEKCSIIEFQI